MLYIKAELLQFVIANLIGQIALAGALFFSFIYQKHDSFFFGFSLKQAKNYLKDSWPLILGGVFTIIYLRLDQLMLKWYLGAKEVGNYSAAVRLTETWFFIPHIITNSVFPAILNAKKVCQQMYYKRLQYLYALMIWSGILIALPMTLFGKEIVAFLYGPGYESAGKVVIIHVWGAIFVFLSSAFGKFLMVENYTLLNLYRLLFGAICNIALNAYLIPLYGINGAAFATLISLFTINIAFDLFSSKLRPHLRMKLRAFYAPWATSSHPKEKSE